MIRSSSDISRILASDPIINAIAVVRIIEDRPPLEAGSGVYIYVKKYPTVSEFEATWQIWLIDFDGEPLDVLASQLKTLLPAFEILEDGVIVKAQTTDLRAVDTEQQPEVPSPSNTIPTVADLNSRFDDLRQSIEDRMLLVGPGRPGRDGRDGKDGRDGRPGRDGTNGKDLQATDTELGDLKNVSVDDAKKNQVLTFDGTDWVPKFVEKRRTISGGLTASELTVIEGLLQTGEPMGHANRTESVISFDNTTRTFTISPIGDTFTVWVKSKRFVFDSPQEVQIPDVTDLYYIYFDDQGVLRQKTSFFTFSSEALTSYVYWDADDNICAYLAEERHGIVLDWQTHEYLHRTRGAAIASGFDISNYTLGGTGTLDSDVQFDISNGTFFDEDVKNDITHSVAPASDSFEQVLQGPAKLPVLYRLGTVWKYDPATNFPVKKGVSHIYYNSITSGVGSLVEADANKYVNYYVIATNNLKTPVVSLMGEHAYANISNARDESFSDLTLTDFPSKEFRFLYKLICRTANYTNAVNAIIQEIQDIRYYSDLPSVIAP